MEKKRNYINALVQFKDSEETTEVIFKVGKVDVDDDMHVFAYLKSEEEIGKLEHPEFKILEHWKGIRLEDKPVNPSNPDEWDEFFSDAQKSPKPE